MNWKPELDELARREAFARQMGGADKVKRQHDAGPAHRSRAHRRPARPRQLPRGRRRSPARAEYDAKGELKNVTPANCVFGRGKVDGRPVVVVGDDFTVRGGSADASIREKPLMAEEMAHDFRLPIIRMIEGSGGGGSVKTIETKGARQSARRRRRTRWYCLSRLPIWRVVPVVALGLGSVAGLGAGAAGRQPLFGDDQELRDVRRRAAGGERGSARTSASRNSAAAEIQTRAGSIDQAVETEEEAFACARRFLSYLPRRSTNCRRRRLQTTIRNGATKSC